MFMSPNVRETILVSAWDIIDHTIIYIPSIVYTFTGIADWQKLLVYRTGFYCSVDI
jgi:hypothetical protein